MSFAPKTRLPALVAPILALILAPILAFGLAAPASAAKGKSFSFMVIGDTAYNVPRDDPRYDALIRQINKGRHKFTIHIGDTKNGHSTCNDARQLEIKSWFDKYRQPVIYTPGDNEWTDCWRPGIGEDPLERLAAIRRIFFSDNKGLGQKSIKLKRQSDVSGFTDYVENQRWSRGRAQFATVHVVGSLNNLRLPDEAEARDKANAAWLGDTFALAKKKNRKAVVIALHANIFAAGDPLQGPFSSITSILREQSKEFDGQILLIHGDTHRLIIDHPFTNLLTEAPVDGHVYENITRLETPGAPFLRAVKVTVDTHAPAVFSFQEVFVP